MEKMQELKAKYWEAISRTRKSGRVAPSVISRVEESWQRFDPEVVGEALRIHTSRYPGYKESYTTGIMRNLQKKKDSTGTVGAKAKGSFDDFKQNSYDFEALERDLLAN